jgi:hypothetical protein
MEEASREINPWGAILFLPVRGSEEAGVTPEPCDAQNVTLENGIVKLILPIELLEGYNVPPRPPPQIWRVGEMRYNISPTGWRPFAPLLSRWLSGIQEEKSIHRKLSNNLARTYR